MFTKKKVADFSAEKQARLNALNDCFVSDVDLVTALIGNLQNTTADLEKELMEIEEYQGKLTEIHSNLSVSKLKNEKVIANFQALVCVD